MGDLRGYVQGQDNNLAGSGVTLSATTATFEDLTYPDGTLIVMADFGTVGYGTFEPETAREENFSFTGLTQNANGTATLTGITRGLAFKAPYTADAALRQAHAGGTIMRFTNSAPFYGNFANKENDETITGVYTFTEATRPLLTADLDSAVNEELITFGQLARTSFSGTVDASTVQKGIVEIATDAELAAGTNVGGTGAILSAAGGSFTVTPTASKVPVANASGLLADGWVALTTAGDTLYSDGTDLQRLAIGAAGLYARSTGSAPSWGGANLDEANTFFGSTDITAAEAETLTDGSNASALHTHAVAILTGTRAQNTASGAQTFAHGLATTPKYIEIHVTAIGADAAVAGVFDEVHSHGYSDGTTHSCVYSGASANGASTAVPVAGSNALACVNIAIDDTGTTSSLQTAVASFDATNVTLTWTLTGTGIGNSMYIVILAHS